MLRRAFRFLQDLVQYLPLWAALTLVRPLPFHRRAAALGAMVGLVMRWQPAARRRFETEITRIHPDMPRAERARLADAMGRNMGRTLFEILNNGEFQERRDCFRVQGPGLAALDAAHAEGRGAIIVSGHFGQWDAVRAVLRARGMETGGVYRPQKNSHYQRLFLAGIEAGGRPIIPIGRAGTGDMVRHLRQGGFFAILVDEKYPEGDLLPFLGKPARTSTAAAKLALRYGLPLVPAYGLRSGADGHEFDVIFEAPIPHSDPLTMTRAINDSLSARVRDHPDQWYWLLRRWQGADDGTAPALLPPLLDTAPPS
jgi:KDO2-lipid IV(A) lauroyltransferase